MTNNTLYWDIVQLSNKILIRRHQLAGHCYRHKQRRTSVKIRPVDTHLWQGKQREIRTNMQQSDLRQPWCWSGWPSITVEQETFMETVRQSSGSCRPMMMMMTTVTVKMVPAPVKQNLLNISACYWRGHILKLNDFCRLFWRLFWIIFWRLLWRPF